MPSLSPREVDAKVAEHLFDWKWVQAPKWDANGPLPEQGLVLVPPELVGPIAEGVYQWPPVGLIGPLAFIRDRYSEDIEAAWRVLERLRMYGERSDIFAAFIDALPHTEDCTDLMFRLTAIDIALAALRSVGIDAEGK